MRINVTVTPCNFMLPKVCKSCGGSAQIFGVWEVTAFASWGWRIWTVSMCFRWGLFHPTVRHSKNIYRWLHTRRQCSQWEEFVGDNSFGCSHLRQPCHVTSHPPDRKFFWAIGQILLELHQFHRCHQQVSRWIAWPASVQSNLQEGIVCVYMRVCFPWFAYTL